MSPSNPTLIPARSFYLEAVDFSDAREFTRKALVHAVPGTSGEDTMIIIAEHEHRTIPNATFAEMFDSTTTRGYYRAKELARAIPNPTGASIRVETGWGALRYGGVNCMIVLSGNRRYLMERSLFDATFKAV